MEFGLTKRKTEKIVDNYHIVWYRETTVCILNMKKKGGEQYDYNYMDESVYKT